jgi:uncharacterized protein (DUF4415 family)
MSAKLTKKAHSEVLAAIWRELPAAQRARLEAVAAMSDEEIDTRDVPEVVDWAGAVRGKFHRPLPQQQLTLRVDADVVEWFQQQAPSGEFQVEMNRVLRQAMLRGRRKRARGAA